MRNFWNRFPCSSWVNQSIFNLWGSPYTISPDASKTRSAYGGMTPGAPCLPYLALLGGLCACSTACSGLLWHPLCKVFHNNAKFHQISMSEFVWICGKQPIFQIQQLYSQSTGSARTPHSGSRCRAKTSCDWAKLTFIYVVYLFKFACPG